MKPRAYSYLRMSTDIQLKGDSRRRQLEGSRAYAEANDLELAEGAELEDIGVSAFKGANITSGALGRFLEAVRSGQVERGSYLIVESLDRISRQQIAAAHSLFLSIIQAGINVVTLIDGHVYKAETADLGDLIVSLVSLSRGYEESQTKKIRHEANWKNKRNLAAQLRPMTRWCPAWLNLSPDRSRYFEIPERAAVVRQIFNDSAEGIGIFRIAHRLNAEHIPTFNESDGWHQSYVAKILSNRAVLGEFQPGRRVEGRRVPDGEPIENYFPRIIDDDLFYRAKSGKAERRKNGAGRKGPAFTNLFSGLATCIYCKSSVAYENKGRGPKGRNYLICSDARRRRGCPSVRWLYQDFETSFLTFVEEIDLNSAAGDHGRSDELRRLNAELAARSGELVEVDELMEKTFDLLKSGGPVEFVSMKLNELQNRQNELKQQTLAKAAEIEELQLSASRFNQSKAEINELIGKIQATELHGSFELRAKLASHLRSVVDVLQVAANGHSPLTLRAANELEQAEGSNAHDVVDYLRNVATDPKETRRYFVVGFRDRRVRGVYPNVDDPRRYEHQVVAEPGLGIAVIKDS